MTNATWATDGRRLRGERTRAAIARRAVDVASVEGLTGLSLNRLATDLGMSKSGIATLFGTKEKLQLAACAAARQVFIDHVITPAFAQPKGLARLRELIDRWFFYITDPVLPGGCFRVASMTEFDSRTGPVRDVIAADRADWLALLERTIHAAQAQGSLPKRDPYALAFQVDALVAAANTALQLGDESAARTARQLVDQLLAAPG